jgi:threonine/homoserine/homoserine lactone efflux protein
MWKVSSKRPIALPTLFLPTNGNVALRISQALPVQVTHGDRLDDLLLIVTANVTGRIFGRLLFRVARLARKLRGAGVDHFVSSFVFGLSIAMPFGPVSMMCVEQTLIRGVGPGLAGGAGAATTHGIYATLAVFGAHAWAAPLAGLQTQSHLFSGMVFVVLGIWTIFRHPGTQTNKTLAAARLGPFLAGVGLALANPMTLLPYFAFAGSMVLTDPIGGLVLTVCGVGLGTLFWYWTMSGSAWLLRKRLPRRLLMHLHLIAGPALIAIGIVTILR